MFGKLIEEVMQGDATGFDLDAASACKVALLDSTGVAAYDFNVLQLYTTHSGDEIANGSGYTTGGEVLASVTATSATGTFTADSTSPTWSTASFTGVRGAIVYVDAVTAPSADPCLVGYDFTSDKSGGGGDFTVDWDATGMFTIDYTPN